MGGRCQRRGNGKSSPDIAGWGAALIGEKFPDLRSSLDFVAARLKVATVAAEFYHFGVEGPGQFQGRCGIHHVVLR